MKWYARNLASGRIGGAVNNKYQVIDYDGGVLAEVAGAEIAAMMAAAPDMYTVLKELYDTGDFDYDARIIDALARAEGRIR